MNYCDNKSKDEDNNNNGTAAAERMQHQTNNEINALQQISKLPAATEILKWHALRGSIIIKKFALDYLATVASSSPLGRANSIAAGIWDNCLRLSDKIFTQKDAFAPG